MPTVAIVDGVRIVFYANEHPPPHFHARFAEFQAVFDLRTLKLERGSLPKAKERAVLDWASSRRDHLMRAWIATQARVMPEPIE